MLEKVTNIPQDGLRCQSNGALDALDDYTCNVMTDTSDPIDDVLFSLLKGDQHMNLAAVSISTGVCKLLITIVLDTLGEYRGADEFPYSKVGYLSFWNFGLENCVLHFVCP